MKERRTKKKLESDRIEMLHHSTNLRIVLQKAKQRNHCRGEVKIRLAMGMVAMVKLTKLWKNKALGSNTKL